MSFKRVRLGCWVMALAVSLAGQAQTDPTSNSSGTSYAVPYYTGSFTLSGTSPIFVSADGTMVGIDTSTPNAGLDIEVTRNSSADPPMGLRVYNTVGYASLIDYPQNHFQTSYAGSGPQGYIYGSANSAIMDQGSTGSLNNAVAGGFRVYNYSTGTITSAWGLNVSSPTISTGGAISRAIGLEIGPQTVTGVPSGGGYGILQDGSSDINSFAGVVSAQQGVRFPDGNTQTVAFNPANCGADYAESVGVTGDRTKYEPGDLLVIDPDTPGKFLKSDQPYSTLVAGIYSTKPGFVGRLEPATAETKATEVPMAMVGRVPSKVSAENGPIRVGDLLVSSSTVGYAMKGTDRTRMLGAVIGKALAPLDSGTGVIMVLVTLQ